MTSCLISSGNFTLMILYLIPCPLGEDDLSRETLPAAVDQRLKETRYYLVENLRTARRFISSRKLGIVIDELQLQELTKDSKKEEIQKWMKTVPAGEPIGVISEAGCPGVADPGAMAVELAHKAGRKVVPLVGPSSILLALMGSGFSGQQFAFHGYLPIDKEARAKAIKAFEKESRQKNQTQIFIETPYRNDKLVEDMLSLLDSPTRLCIAAGLTTSEERIEVKTVNDWKKLKSLPWGKNPAIFLIAAY